MSGPLPRALLPITVPMSWVYRGIVAARNARFDRGMGVNRLPVPTISIGNITTGGTGKSPMVAWVCEALREAGHRPVIAMRGYGSRDGRTSDEQTEFAQRLPSVPLVVDPNRYSALREVLPSGQGGDDESRAWPEIDCVVLDDGFQHRALARDLDLVLIDASASSLHERLLPAGHGREPPTCLHRADAVVVTRAKRHDAELEIKIVRHHGRPPLAWSRHVWSSLKILDQQERDERPSWLAEKRVLTMFGVGNPTSVRSLAEAAGALVTRNLPVRDHQRYGPRIIERARAACAGVDAMIVTGKDWVKLQDLLDWHSWPVPIVVPRLEIDVFEGAEALRKRLRLVMRKATAGESVR